MPVEDPLQHTAWREAVPFFASGGHCSLLAKLADLRKTNAAPIYPPQEYIFRAFQLTPFEKVRVLILGQDPYHGAGQAHGLSFSVPQGVKVPRSLQNIRKEILRDVYDGHIPSHWDEQSGNLEDWARQGVLLLNAVLSVEAKKAGSHAQFGWQELTVAVLETLAARKKPLAVLLWGAWAGQFASIFDAKRHLVLQAAHPSPFSASRGFFGCGHFSQVNAWLCKQDEQKIIW